MGKKKSKRSLTHDITVAVERLTLVNNPLSNQQKERIQTNERGKLYLKKKSVNTRASAVSIRHYPVGKI
jgi:hypothetical protein